MYMHFSHFLFLYISVFFLKNRATKTCQSLKLVVNLMLLHIEKIKSHLKKSFHLTETSVLKVTKAKLSSFVWKIRQFNEQVLELASPIAKPFPQFTLFFIATGLPKTIQTNIAQQYHVLQPPI